MGFLVLTFGCLHGASQLKFAHGTFTARHNACDVD